VVQKVITCNDNIRYTALKFIYVDGGVYWARCSTIGARIVIESALCTRTKAVNRTAEAIPLLNAISANLFFVLLEPAC
jgi:hypothetical protein